MLGYFSLALEIFYSKENFRATPPLKGKPDKTNPPYPPLVRGARKSKTPSARRRRIAFLYPPDKGLLKNSLRG